MLAPAKTRKTNYMTEYEKAQLIDGEEDICVDVHSSGIGLLIVGGICCFTFVAANPGILKIFKYMKPYGIFPMWLFLKGKVLCF